MALHEVLDAAEVEAARGAAIVLLEADGAEALVRRRRSLRRRSLDGLGGHDGFGGHVVLELSLFAQAIEQVGLVAILAVWRLPTWV